MNTNPNISTRVDGQTISAAVVPMPEGTQQGSTSVNLDVGDFKAAVSSGDTPDTPAKKVRHGRFGDIEYDTAGYYLYRMTETGSRKWKGHLNRFPDCLQRFCKPRKKGALN